MDRESLRTAVCEIVAEVAEVDPSGLTGETRFADLRMDSMQLLEVVALSEKRFRVALPDDILPRLTSVNAAVEAVAGLLLS